MAQPPAYYRKKNFTEDSGAKTDHSALNAELDTASDSINDIRANLAILQADDGKLRPSAVTADSISYELRASLVSNVVMDAEDMLRRSQAAAEASEIAAASIRDDELTSAANAKIASECAEKLSRAADYAVNPDWLAESGPAEILNKPTTLEEYGIRDEVETKLLERVPDDGTAGQALSINGDGDIGWSNLLAQDVLFDNTGTKLVSTEANDAIVEVNERIPFSNVRNTVLSGRVADGLPAYLSTHETYWMPTFKNTSAPGSLNRPGYLADVFCSAVYNNDANYSHEVPLVNQKAVLHAQRYMTPAAVTSGFWGVILKEPQVFTMVEIVYNASKEIPQTIQVQATNEDNWDDPVNITGVIVNKTFGPDNLSIVTKDYARRYWFADNITRYKSYRLFFGQATTPTTYSASFLAVRFYRHPDESAGPLKQNDAILISKKGAPFVLSIAKGVDGDQTVKVNSSVIIPGSFLSELSRNYFYVVPADQDGSCPDYVDASRAIELENNAYLVVDNRKINYGEQSQIERRCLVNFRCDLPTDSTTTANTFYTGNAGYVQGLNRLGVSISEADNFRGSRSAFIFPNTTGGGAYIHPDNGSSNANWHANTINPRAQSMAGAKDWTFEADLKYLGPNEANDDEYRVIFDSGNTSGQGIIFAYWHRRGHFSVYCQGSNWFYKWPYVMDDKWHTVSLSHRNGNAFLHVDGKCLGAYAGFPPVRRGVDYWMIGRQLVSDVYRWTGNISAFRWIVGDALYCSDDYTPSPVFHSSMIPDRTLWYDHQVGVVKTWHAGSRSWRNTPMCPIGHIDTLYRDHLHSEAPRGMQVSYGVQNIRNITSSGNYSASYPPAAAFNFGNGAVDWLTPTNTATVEHWLQIELESALSFDRLRLIALTSAANLWAFPAIFQWQGSHDGATWTTLVDRSAFVRDGMPNNAIDTPSGAAVWWFSGMKQFPYEDETPYRFYRLVLSPKGAIPYYSANAYSGVRLQLPLRGAAAEIASCVSYAIGGVYTYGPFMIGANKEVEIPVPFGGAPFTIDGDVEERHDWQSKKRKMGNSGNYESNGRNSYGEEIYARDDSVVIYTGANLSTLIGTWNTASLASASDMADYTITFRRKF